MTNRVKTFASNLLVRNAASLYGVQICRKLLPLVSIPYLARVLGPVGWGKVAFVQSLGDGMVLLLEYGFTLSATREIARHRESKVQCAAIVSGTLGAQALLSIPAILGAFLAGRYVPMLRNQPALLAAGIVYGVAQGVAPIWFFQGLEKLALASALEVSSKLAGLIGLFILVRHQGDEWIVLLLQALAPAASTVAALYLARRLTAFGMPQRCDVRRSLSQGWQMFLLRSSSSLYGAANSFVLGLLTTPTIVGYYASAEKITRSVSGLLLPIRESLYPRLSHLAGHSPDEARRLTRLGVILMGGGGFFLGLATCLGAPWIIHILMGPKFGPSIPVLQVLAALPFVVALTDSVGLQHLLPHGKENVVNPVMLAGGLFNLIAAFVIAPRFEAIGMAWCVVATESLVCITLMLIVLRSHYSPASAETIADGNAAAELVAAADV